jgi:hypothetical protein
MHGLPFTVPLDVSAATRGATSTGFAFNNWSASTLMLAMAPDARSGVFESDRLWVSEVASPTDAVLMAFSESSDFHGALVAIGSETISADDGFRYQRGTALIADNPAGDPGQEPFVWCDMGRVESVNPSQPMLADGSQPAEYLDIAASDASLQSPSAPTTVFHEVLLARKELALDRDMGQTVAFGLNSASAIPVTEQGMAATRGESSATAELSARSQPFSATEPLSHGDRSVSASWGHRAVSGVMVVLIACEEWYFGKRRTGYCDEQSAGRLA